MKKSKLCIATLALGLAFSASAQKTITLQSADVLPRVKQFHDDHYGINIAKNGPLVLVGSNLDDTDSKDGICSNGSLVNVNENNGGAILYGQSSGNLKYQLPARKDANGNVIQVGLGRSVALNNNWAIFGAENGKVYLERKTGGDFIGKINDSILPPSVPGVTTGVFDFGTTLAANDNFLVIGAPQARVNDTVVGVAFVYKHANINGKNTWVYFQTIKAAKRRVGEQFATSVALFENRIIAGDPNYALPGGVHQGRIYIFNILSNSIVLSFTHSPTVNNAKFGTAVAINRDYYVVGAPGFNGGGRVDFFKTSNNTVDGIIGGVVADENFGGTVAIDNNSQRVAIGTGLVGLLSVDRITLVERDNNVNLWKRKAFVTAFSPNRTHNTGIGSSIVITQGEVAVGMGNYTYGLQRCNGVATTGGYRDFSGAIAKFQFDNVVGRSARMGDADENSLDAASVETLSPNPSMGESVTFQSASEILNVTANNQNGTVSDLSFKGNQINVSALIPGIYVLKIETATGVVVKKLSVQ